MARSDYTFDGTKLRSNVRDSILGINHSASMNSVAQLSISVADQSDFEYLSYGIFDAGVVITSDDLAADYEIAAVEVRDSPAPYSLGVSARSKPAQYFKKTKTAMVKNNISPSEFLATEAASVGGTAVSQETTKRTISRINNENQQESTWDVMKKIAGELKYEFWEYKGVFYFGKEEWFLGKPVKWIMSYDKGQPITSGSLGHDLSDARYITSFGVPNCRRSEDSKDVTMTVSISVNREEGELLAPGDTVYFYGIPTWENKYLITSMESDLLEPASVVSVQLGTIIKPPEKKKQGGGGGTGLYEEIFPYHGGVVIAKGTAYVRENKSLPAYPWSASGAWVLGKEAGDYTGKVEVINAYAQWGNLLAEIRNPEN